jgi:hypothetical protein
MQDPASLDFLECPKGEVRRIPIPRTPVNKRKKKGRSPAGPRPCRLGIILAVLLPCLLYPWSRLLEVLRSQRQLDINPRA